MMMILAIAENRQKHRIRCPAGTKAADLTPERCAELLRADGFTPRGQIELLICTNCGCATSALGTITMEGTE